MHRIDKLLSSLGYCSRKEAQHLCDEGRVTLGDDVVDDASRKVDGAQLRVDGEALEFPSGLFVVLHKPLGLVCSHDAKDGARVYDVLPPRWLRRDPRVTTIGRLDKDTSGVLLLTDQGALVQRYTSPRHHVDKVYVATLDAPLEPETVEAFARGLVLTSEAGEEACQPAVVRALEGTRAEVTLREGKYHQVRRMFAACGQHVLALERTRFGEWTLEGLAPGEWRALPLPR